MRRSKAIHRRDSGQSLVEFAIVLPILLGLLVGIFEFGVAWNRKQVLTNAAREGARAAVLQSVATDTDVDAVVDPYLTSAGIDPDAVSKSYNNVGGSTGDTVTIQLQMNHTMPFISAITGFLADSPTAGAVTLTSVVNMRHE
ncbi:MAG TPA: TadE/TadG family type IV pilus assembly protein [Gemmatimonadota bacterium]|nr:TadE/TadG family type IV pilus assembly protein [Gemmatimonadota bacterium]